MHLLDQPNTFLARSGGPLGSEQILNCNSHFLDTGHTGFTLAIEAFPAEGTWRTRANDAPPLFSNAIAGGSIVPNTWTQLTAVFDPSRDETGQLLLYVDGVVFGGDGMNNHGKGPFKWTNGLQRSSTSSCTIGGHPSMAAYFDGMIDEVRIFDHALSAGAVSEESVHYWCNSLAASAPLLFYSFAEGGGLTVHDESPYHNDLDISSEEHVGDAAWVSNGKCGPALEVFTGTDGDCLVTESIPIGSSVTFSMWVYLHEMVPVAVQAMHCHSVSNPAQTFVFGTDAEQTHWSSWTWLGKKGDDASHTARVDGPDDSDDPNAVHQYHWTHLAAVIDPSIDDPRQQIKFYIN